MSQCQTRRLGELISLEYGRSLPEAQRDSSGKIVVAGSNGPQGFHSQALVSAPGIIIGRKGSAGQVNWYDKDFWPIDTTYFAVAKTELNYRWLFYCLCAARLPDLATATGVPGLNRNDVYEIRVCFPTLPEQERIVQILDEVEALHRLHIQADERAKELSISLFLEMFGNPLSGSSQWQTKRVSDICDLVRGSSPRPKGDPRYFGGPVPRLMIEDITRDGWWVTPRVDSLTIEGARLSRPVKAGTVVMAVSGNIGLCAQLAVDACVHDGFVAFTNLDQAFFDSSFFGKAMSLLKEMNTRVQAGAIFQNITTTDVKALEVICPPLPAQQEFSACIDEIHELGTAQAARRQRLDDLFQTLMHRAFQGEL